MARKTTATNFPQKTLPLSGETFTVAGWPAFVILPEAKSTGRPMPWVWYAPTLPGLPGPEEGWMFERFTKAGIAIVGIDVGESYGSPDGRALFTALYTELTQKRGFAAKMVLLGRSRGGLMTLGWAVENPEKVAGFAGIYPVCDLTSYPGVAQACGAYHLTEAELTARLKEHNPIEKLAGLAKACVPLFAIQGDSDTVVPLERNAGEVKRRYEALGGAMQLIVPPGQGHNMWPGFFQCQALVDFVLAQTSGISLSAPQDYQVIQRSSRTKGKLIISGMLAAVPGKGTTLEARLGEGGWRKLKAKFEGVAFTAALDAPAGGWYRLEVRAMQKSAVLAEASVAHVGVGEVFVVAGQSNSANHGEEKQSTKTGNVVTFDGKGWRPANDPQPGASGGGGSFLPPFGDAIATRFNVPVGFVACGIGASSVREWLPQGSTFPNPPTIESRVQRRADGLWECKGEAFAMFTSRMKLLGSRGFRAVLWHQGESDANQRDTTRTLAGNLYHDYLAKLIQDSRRAIGWDAPWFVAQVSYHVPGDEASPDIRAAQATLWKERLALQGPDSDALKSEWRDTGGKGVHFSGPGLREHAARWVEKVAPWLERQ
ncbi:sialate O-acetylesterase [Armatimonas sp.]|uniref:sialate O-acetylesterase n=1 Tax=Armatimonas sp. TaxID=1872638 RepID=UPI00286C468F|nr:sialate O-acetylesterase [Armatimonas sp.]